MTAAVWGKAAMGATGINWQVARHVRAVGRIRGSAAPGTGNIGTATGTIEGTAASRATTTRSSAQFPRGGRMDLVGFGGDGVWVALANGDGTFANANVW